MTKALEQALWQKNKRSVIDEYLQTVKQVEDNVAMQGFLNRPGFLGRITTQIESALKYKLSDINFEIVKEAVERELAQTGHDYDIAIKEAMIAWELEKTTTLTALDREFTANNLTRELDKQQLERMEISINLRKLVIMALKTAIDIEMESIRQEMTEVERSTYPSENALLSAQLVTAQKKLEVIPYIQDVLDKQQSIIDAEKVNAERKDSLVSVKEDVNAKKVELITARQAIASAIVELIAERQTIITKRQSLIEANGLVADQEQVNVTYLDQLIDALVDVDSAKQRLITARKALISKKEDLVTANGLVIDQEATNAGLLEEFISSLSDLDSARESLITAKQATMAKREALVDADGLVVAQEQVNAGFLSQYIASLEGLDTERQGLITAKLALFPYINEKSEALIAEAAAMDAWIIVKQAIAASKERMALQMETRVERKSDIIDSKVELNAMELDLQEARINLEIAKITGRSDLLFQQTKNAATFLAEKQTAFQSRVTREGELIGRQIDLDMYESNVAYATANETGDVDFESQTEYLSRESVATNTKEREMAELAADARITSELVHLLK